MIGLSHGGVSRFALVAPGKAKSMKHLSAIIALCVLGGAVSLRAANCKNWKQPVFWETATDARVMWCLENGSNASAMGKDGRTPLLHATLFQRSPEIVRALLKRHVDSERQDKWNARPMHYAARNPDTTTVSTLLTFNARHSPENRWGLTPLHFAARYNPNPDMIGILVSHGASLEARTSAGSRPLHFAARYNPNADVIRTLLALGAYASPSNDDGITPLHYAAGVNSNPDVARALLAAGALTDERDSNGHTPIDVALSSAHRDLIAASGGRSGPGPKPKYQADIAGSIMSGMLSGLESATDARSAPRPQPGPSSQPEHRNEGMSQQEIEAKLRQQQEQRDEIRRERERQNTLRERIEVQRSNAKLLQGDCRCIGIREGGQYVCLDGLVVGNSSSGKPLCDIRR